MKAITLHQPWASLIAIGLKQYETRSWQTNYRGSLAIHAAKRQIQPEDFQVFRDALQLANKNYYDLAGIPTRASGNVVAICNLIDCVLMDENFINQQTQLERLVGQWEQGRFAWKLEKIIALQNPIPAKGNRRLWNCSLQGGIA